MRLSLPGCFLIGGTFVVGRVSAFVPSITSSAWIVSFDYSSSCKKTVLASTAETSVSVDTETSIWTNALDIGDPWEEAEEAISAVSGNQVLPLTGEALNLRLQKQLEKLRIKDQTSRQLSKEDLGFVYIDEDILVVDKPSGVLTVGGKEKNPNVAQAVFDAIDDVDLPSGDHMIVHRLGMDTSGLLVMAKSKAATRGLNGAFRERKVGRKYEALVVGHMENNEGIISLPIMRDYECPPYVRISTDDHQRALLNLDPEEVGKKILEGPKESITKYEVVAREELNGQPVTRVTLTSISGRYHQLNVHMAAFGHPIVGDTVYGYKGEAVRNGGLTDAELDILAPNPNRASEELQAAVARAAGDMPACVHAKYLKFRHPVTKKTVEFSTESPF